MDGKYMQTFLAMIILTINRIYLIFDNAILNEYGDLNE